MATAMEVKNPRHILAVSLDDESNQLCRVIKDLTGTTPQQTSTSLAGTTHHLPLNTPYYTATVPIWLDLIAAPSDWAASFLSDEAREVLSVLGGVVLVFALPPAGDAATSSAPASSSLPSAEAEAQAPESEKRLRGLIRHFGSVVKDGLGGWEWDGVGLAVGVGEGGDAEMWDDLCAEAGLEFVQLTGRQQERNEFGEKTGIERVKEALESNDWAQLDDASPLSDFGDFEDAEGAGGDADSDEKELDPESLEFGVDKADFEGLRKAIWEQGADQGDDADDEAEGMGKGVAVSSSKTDATGATQDQDQATQPQIDKGKQTGTQETQQQQQQQQQDLDQDDVVKLESMMRKLQAVREAGEGMGEEQRRRMAARAVQEVMKEL